MTVQVLKHPAMTRPTMTRPEVAAAVGPRREAESA